MSNRHQYLSLNDEQSKDSSSLCRCRRWTYIIIGLSLVLIGVAISALVWESQHKSHDDPVVPDNPAWEQSRLSDQITPSLYNIDLMINITSMTYYGTETITIDIAEPTDVIVFHQGTNLVSENIVVTETSSDLIITLDQTFLYPDNEYIVLQSQSILPAGEYTIAFQFNANISQTLDGLYGSTYKTPSGKSRWLATTQFEPTSARNAFPCFDEPTFKAVFDISITCESQYHAISNKPVQSKTPNNKDNTTKYQFQPTDVMSSYLVAFVVSDFVSHSVNTTSTSYPSPTLVSVWTHNDTLPQTLLALNVTKSLIPYYEDLFGMEFPLDKLDLIGIPDYAGTGMENWGLITFDELLFLYDPASSAQSNEQAIISTIAHEIVHQWFGDLVTTNWWSELWLNEGFAQFLEYTGTDHVRPKWNMSDQFHIISQRTALLADSRNDTHPVVQDVETEQDAVLMFDNITYDKSASLNRMMQTFLTPVVYFQGLQNYLVNNSYDNTWSDDYLSALTNASIAAKTPYNVNQIMNNWLYEEGYPVLTVTEVPTGIEIKQQRFYSDFKGNSTVRWYIYITADVPSEDDTINSTWLTPAQDSVIIKYDKSNPYIKLNTDQNMFYRVNYPLRIWQALSQAMMDPESILSDADKAGLLDDAFALAQAGLIVYDIPLNMTQYLSNETSYIVWSMVEPLVQSMGSRLYMTPSYGTWAAYMQSILLTPYQKVGWNKTSDATLNNLLQVRILTLACTYEVPGCRDKAMSLFQQLIRSNYTYNMDVNIRDLVYRIGIADGPSSYFDSLYNQYSLVSNSESDRILRALSSARNPSQLQGLLNDAMNGDTIRFQDALGVIENVAANPIGTPVAWNFVRNNWATLAQRYRMDLSFPELLNRICSGFQTQPQLDELNAFITAQGANLGTAASGAQHAVATIKTNIAWLTNNLQGVTDWLNS